jgi:hypothetical protein
VSPLFLPAGYGLAGGTNTDPLDYPIYLCGEFLHTWKPDKQRQLKLMEQTFTAHNELEKKLMAAQQGQIDSQTFMEGLLAEQLFMPVEDEASEIQGFQRSTKAQPLTLEAEDGTRVLVLFTSPERAKPFLQDHPDYQGGLLSEFSWILERIGSGIAIAINPGFEVGIDLDTDTVVHLIHLNTSRQQNPQASS